MSKRYFAKPSAHATASYDFIDASDFLARTVHETDSTPYDTGLLDASGTPIMAAYETEPIGFVRFGDSR